MSESQYWLLNNVIIRIILYSSNGPSAHLDLVEKMSVNVKKMQKAIKLLSKEAAILETEKFKQKETQPTFLIVRKVADECDSGEFQNTLVREMKSAAPDLKVLVVFMEDKPTSQLLVTCPDDALLNKVAIGLCEALDITLGPTGPICKNGRFQGKFTHNAKNMKKCEQVVSDLVSE